MLKTLYPQRFLLELFRSSCRATTPPTATIIVLNFTHQWRSVAVLAQIIFDAQRPASCFDRLLATPFFFDGEEDWEAFHSRAHHAQVEAQHSRKTGRMPGRRRRALPQCWLDLAHHMASATAAAAATTRMSAEALVLAAQIADQQAVVAAAQYQLMQQQGLRSRRTKRAAAPNTPPVGDPAPHEQPMTPRSLPMTPPLLSGSATQPTKAQHIPGRLRKSVARRCASSLVRGSHKSKPRPTVSREPREHPVAAPIPCEPHGSARDSIARPHAQSVQTKSLSPAVAKLSKSPSVAAQREQTKPRFVRPPTIRPRPPTVSAPTALYSSYSSRNLRSLQSGINL